MRFNAKRKLKVSPLSSDTMLSLTVINCDHIHISFRLDSSAGACYSIGRSPDCDVALPNEVHLSRVHCFLSVDERGLLLTDNNSSNGIYENELRVSQIRVQPGCLYGIGNCSIRVDYLPDAAEPLPPAPAPEPTRDAPEPPPPSAPCEPPATHAENSPPAPPAEPAEPLPVPVSTKLRFPKPAENDAPQKRPKFVPPPPRKAPVERAAPRPFYTAAGKLNTDSDTPRPKELKHRRTGNSGVKRPASQAGTELGLPNDFKLSIRLLNTTETLETGDLLRFGIVAEEACYIYLLQYDSKHHAAMLVPGVGGAQNTLEPRKVTQFPPVGNKGTYELYVEEPYGTDTIIALACTKNSDFAKLWGTLSAHALSPAPAGELELQAIQHCMKKRGMQDAKWASAVLSVNTGPAPYSSL